MDKKKIKLGTYSNKGLGVGLLDINYSEEQFNRATEIVDADLKEINQDVKEQFERLDSFIKKEIGAIPRMNDFILWFFDKKKINQSGKKLPKITDEEIIHYAIQYVETLKNLIPKSNNEQFGLKSFKWLASEEELENLYYSLLKQEFIAEIDFQFFKGIFSQSNCSDIVHKIIWLKNGLNKKPNKKSITDLIEVLEENNFIIYEGSIIKILNSCFKSRAEDFKFTHANRSKEGDYSQFRIDLEKIVKSL